MSTVSQASSGFEIVPAVLTESEVFSLSSTLRDCSLGRSRAGARHLMANAAVACVARDPRLLANWRSQLSRCGAIPYRATPVRQVAAEQLAGRLASGHSASVARSVRHGRVGSVVRQGRRSDRTCARVRTVTCGSCDCISTIHAQTTGTEFFPEPTPSVFCPTPTWHSSRATFKLWIASFPLAALLPCVRSLFTRPLNQTHDHPAASCTLSSRIHFTSEIAWSWRSRERYSPQPPDW